MGRSVITQSEARGIRTFLGAGLQHLDMGIPLNYSQNPHFCPFFLDESCEGAKDPEYKTRCRGENFAYSNCALYSLSEKRRNQVSERLRVSDPLSDTVIMSAEDVVGLGRK